MKIAFVGLGNMGSGMCLNLIKAGFDVTAYDLNADSMAAIASRGGTTANSLEECATGAHTVVTMLPAGRHVLDVYFGENGIAKTLNKSALLIDCSTIAVEDARHASSLAAERGLAMVDAPVSGGVAAANAGSLTFMVGGAEGAYDRARPILEAMGKNIVFAGASGNGQVAKIANNMLLGVSMIATSEAFNLAERLGLDAQTFFDIASKASGQNWSMTSYCPAPGPVPTAPSNHDYKPGFAVDMMLKDLNLASEAAASCDAPITFGNLAQNVYQSLSSDGFGDLDFSGVMRRIEKEI
nr:3-hydroxyisobutyrate dehydrogenase [Hyphomonas sp. Mor2]